MSKVFGRQPLSQPTFLRSFTTCNRHFHPLCFPLVHYQDNFSGSYRTKHRLFFLTRSFGAVERSPMGFEVVESQKRRSKKVSEVCFLANSSTPTITDCNRAEFGDRRLVAHF